LGDEVPNYQAEVRRDVPRAFLVDVVDYFQTAARQAKQAITGSHVGIEGGIPLGVRRGNRAAGLIRYQVMDEAFEQLVARHGGEVVGQVQVEGAEGPQAAPIYLTTALFGSTLVGFASHHEHDDLPVKNASRTALCAQNIGLGGDIFRPPELYVDRPRFALLMIQRDAFDIGKIASITVSIVDPMMRQFLMQVDVNEFVASYGSTAVPKPTVELRKQPGRFRKGEDDADDVGNEKK
jgi:hypothetical protein